MSAVKECGLAVEKLSEPLKLSVFSGPNTGTVEYQCRVARVQVGAVQTAWKFLVLRESKYWALLGLDFMRHNLISYDPATDLLICGGFGNPRSDVQVNALRPEPSETPPDECPTEECGVIFESLPQEEWAEGGRLGPRGYHTELDKDVSGERMTICSVTADSEEDAEKLRKVREQMPKDLLKIVDEHPNLFRPPDAEPPERSVKHGIKLTPEAVPVKRSPYPLSPVKLKALHEQMSELISQGWVEPSNSPWGAPILFVPKKNGALRLCVDFRDLNSVTIDDSYPLPRLEVLLHRAANAKYFSKLDLASGFHQIEVDPGTRPLTAFRLPEAVSGSSLWQWKVMPFGLRNAPPTFQRAMALALNGCEHCAVVYIDDILIFSRTREEHLEHLRTVFAKLEAHSYHVRLAKCEFLKEEVEFLGHRISSGGISTHPDKVKALVEWPAPLTNAKQVKSFMGLVVWYLLPANRFGYTNVN